MKAVRIERFGGPEAVTCLDADVPAAGAGEALIRVRAAGVGPWDAWIRAGRSQLVGPELLPLTLGADFSGVVVSVGEGVLGVEPGDTVFGVTNARFIGAQAEFAVAQIGRIARKPAAIGDAEAASIPVIAVTAWQMLFEHARVQPGERVLVSGAAGAVGGFIVQMARAYGVHVIALAAASDEERLRGIGADTFVDPASAGWEGRLRDVDSMLDLVGGPLQVRGLACLKPGGTVVSAVEPPQRAIESTRPDVHGTFFIVDVDSPNLERIARAVDGSAPQAHVGAVLPFSAARTAHEMLEGQRPRPRGRIVLTPDA